ncbi:hypothetical protein DR950_00345 [Kitasatospora xanthocidica]|uniref:Uncharacterized protein n=2 Tax=Kitasatospora TaxID=2063 RepID=A0A372ZKR6_9ACTN|nr:MULTISPECIES: hypothetical protein [Kitasatospora]RGD56443.1 hypothetical protein DR950_00345 [Kitasatospora xanthocidica]
MTIDRAALDSAMKAVVAAAHADDPAALYQAVMPPAGTDTPPAEVTAWFGTLLIHLALSAATTSKLERGCPREAVSGWIGETLGPPPTPALLRAADPGRIDHAEAVSAAADYSRCHEYTVDLIRLGLAEPNEAPDERGVDAHCAATNDSRTRITVIAMLGRLAPVPGGRA